MGFADAAHGDVSLHRSTVFGGSLPLRYVNNRLLHSSAGDAITCGSEIWTDGIAFGVDGRLCINTAV